MRLTMRRSRGPPLLTMSRRSATGVACGASAARSLRPGAVARVMDLAGRIGNGANSASAVAVSYGRETSPIWVFASALRRAYSRFKRVSIVR